MPLTCSCTVIWEIYIVKKFLESPKTTKIKHAKHFSTKNISTMNYQTIQHFHHYTHQFFSNGCFPYAAINMVASNAARSSQLLHVHLSHTVNKWTRVKFSWSTHDCEKFSAQKFYAQIFLTRKFPKLRYAVSMTLRGPTFISVCILALIDWSSNQFIQYMLGGNFCRVRQNTTVLWFC